MYLEEIKIFTELIKSEICAIPLKTEIAKQITPERLKKLYVLASKHDLTHIVAVALKKHNLLGEDEISKNFLKVSRLALLRYEMMQHEQSRIQEAFEQAGIAFVPLKGAVIRKYYPESWMRTSCDIDVLVREEELEKAKERLVSDLNYKVVKYNYHDIAMYSPSNVLLELHFHILENEEKIDGVLEKVWDYVHPIEQGKYQNEMTPEYLMFHALAHMLYHFIHGGCGVRYIVDLWLLEKQLTYDKTGLDRLCKEAGMDVFADYVNKVARVWFEEEKHDSVSEKMEKYIISGGVFGDFESKVTARKTKTNGQAQYLLQRVFIPYKEFCASFPKLKKYPVLYPYYTWKRWMKVLDRRVVDKAMGEVKLNQEISKDSVNELKKLFKDLNL